MKDKNIIITGGAGFIGSHLAEELSKTNDVKIIDDLSSGFIQNIAEFKNKVNFVKADIRSKEIQKEFENIEIVFHQAANIEIAKSFKNPLPSTEVNILGTLNILEACRKFDCRLIFASSTSIYGEPKNLPIKENHTLNPTSPYALSKKIGEEYCKLYSEIYGLKTLSLRYFNVYGPKQRATSPYSGVISIFIRNLLNNKPLIIYGDGEQTRDFVNVKDVAQANILAARSKVLGKAINIGTGKQTSINQLVKILAKITGKKLEVIHKSQRIGDVKYSLADITLAKELLNWEPKISLESGLRELVK